MKRPHGRSVAIVCAALALTACGGGGDSSPAQASASSQGGANAQSTSAGAGSDSTSTQPGVTGASGQAFNASYFPIGPTGAYWLFDVLDNAGTKVGNDQIVIASSDGSGNAVFQENDRGTISSQSYSEDRDGVYLNLSMGNGIGAMAAMSMRLYSFADAAPGQIRTANNAASADVDGDGLSDRAEYRLTQTMVGYDDASDLPIRGGVAHFQNVLSYRLTLGNGKVSGYNRTEDIWLAPNLGPVKMQRSTNDLQSGQTSVGWYRLVSAQLGSASFTAP